MTAAVKVTIAVPTYRSSGCIGPTIASALEQTYERVRVMVMDNCSEDDTVAVVGEAAQRHRRRGIVTIIRHSDHVGRIANWNRCIEAFEASNDDYLKFLFAGDRLHPDSVADLTRAAVGAEAALASSAYEIFDDGRRSVAAALARDRVLSPREALAESVRRGNWFGAPSAILLSRDAVSGLRFADDFGWGGDWKFCLDACRRGPSVWLERPLATIDLGARQFYSEQAGRFASRVEDAWLRYYALDRLRHMDAPGCDCDDLERELEQSVKHTLLNRRDLIDVTAGKFVRRLQEALR